MRLKNWFYDYWGKRPQSTLFNVFIEDMNDAFII